jgi:hypothetical protein
MINQNPFDTVARSIGKAYFPSVVDKRLAGVVLLEPNGSTIIHSGMPGYWIGCKRNNAVTNPLQLTTDN